MRLSYLEIALKVLSQLLVAAAGVSVLFAKESSTYSLAVGRRKLTFTGWLQVAGISAGLVLFTFSEFVSHSEKSRTALQSEAQTSLLKEQLQASADSIGRLKSLADQQKQVIDAQTDNAREQRAIKEAQAKQLDIAAETSKRARSAELSRSTLTSLDVHWSTVVRTDFALSMGEWSIIAGRIEELDKTPVRSMPPSSFDKDGQGVGDTAGWLARCSPKVPDGPADCWVERSFVGISAGLITNPIVPAGEYFQRSGLNSKELVWWGAVKEFFRPLGPRFQISSNGRELVSNRRVFNALYSVRRLAEREYLLEASLTIMGTKARYDDLDNGVSLVAERGRWRFDSRDPDAQFSAAVSIEKEFAGAIRLNLHPKFASEPP